MTQVRIDRTERLLNLVICLMAARTAVHRAVIRQRIPGYPDGDAAFERMFERDKDELRGMGIPIETVTDAHGDVLGYRIERSAAQLPSISVTAAERAVLVVAASLWDTTLARATAVLGIRKIEAAMADSVPSSDDAPGEGSVSEELLEAPVFAPRLSSHDAALIPLIAALRSSVRVEFDYRSAGSVEVSRRRIDPWGVIADQGRWYVIGFDDDRDAPRAFRLSRIRGEVQVLAVPQQHRRPADLDGDRLRAMLTPGAPEGEASAEVRVKAGQAARLRQLSKDGFDQSHVTGVLSVRAPSREHLLEVLCSSGNGAVVCGPADVREEVERALAAVLDRHEAPS